MKSFQRCALLILVILLLSISFTLALPRPLRSCGAISSSGIYVLTSDITATDTAGCLLINANNVLINCQGYSITGLGSGIGVDSTSYTNTKIENCMIGSFDTGIYFNAVVDGNIKDSNFENFNDAAIVLEDSTSVWVQNNIITGIEGTDTGIKLDNTDYSFIKQNNISLVGYHGLYLEDADYNTILENNIETTETYISYPYKSCIYMDSSTYNDIVKNYINLLGYGYGIYNYYSSYNSFILNEIYADLANIASSESTGIYEYFGSNDEFIKNIIVSADEGLYFDYSLDNTISQNKISACDEGFICSRNCIDNVIEENTFSLGLIDGDCTLDYMNDMFGIYVSDSNLITDNLFYDLKYGLFPIDSNTLIYNNIFFDNTYNAYEYSTFAGNTWYTALDCTTENILGGSCLGGNYWDDYAGTDTDGDGIGDTDTPYTCSSHILVGGDIYPLVGSVYEITSCSDDPNVAGTWIVSEEITATLAEGETCIDILADDVRILCGGSFSGNGYGTAIDVNGYSNAAIKNCFIDDFTYGIALSGSTYTELSGNVIT